MNYFLSIGLFFHKIFTIYKTAGKGRPNQSAHYHLHPLHEHLRISRAITAESSPLHIASDRTRNGNLWFLSASR